jgi:polyhydroxybutyrate depolymerase
VQSDVNTPLTTSQQPSAIAAGAPGPFDKLRVTEAPFCHAEPVEARHHRSAPAPFHHCLSSSRQFGDRRCPSSRSPRTTRRTTVAGAVLACVAVVFTWRIATAKDSDFPAKGSVATAESRTLAYRGGTRTYLIQRVRRRGRHPVVILLHGGDSDGKRVWAQTSLPTLGARDGFILVAPNASINNHWNDGRGTVGEGNASSADDVGYLKALISAVVARDDGEADAVFMVGVSNGGIMTMHFACQAGQLLRAAGNVISNLPTKELSRCAAGRPLPWISINGDMDPRMPFNGYAESTLVNRRPQAGLESADKTFAFFADRARCLPRVRVETLTDSDKSDGSTAERRVRAGCVGGTTSTQYILHGAGHNVPGLAVEKKRVREFGFANQDIDAGTVIWRHFQQTL